MTSTTVTPTSVPAKRHPVLMAWLYFSIIMKCVTAAYYFFGPAVVAPEGGPEWNPANLKLMAVFALLSVVCMVGILRWKKIGFYGEVALSAAIFAYNLSLGIPIASASLGFLGVVITYGLLNVGGENRAWTRLR